MEDMKQTPMPKMFEDLINQMKQMLQGDEISHEAVAWKDYIFMPMATIESVEYLSEWDMPENSVFVVSFPKTGTAWCMETVRHILYGTNEEILQRSKDFPAPLHLLEAGPRAKFDVYPKLPLPRKFFATHLPEQLFPYERVKERNCKVIYVIRNPKDQAVSWFHFAKKLPISEQQRKNLGEGWDEFIARYLNGEHPHSLKRGEWYPDHIANWLKYRDDENFLMVEYEAMKKDFPKEIGRMAKFLGVDLSDSEVNKVAERCSIGSMKQSADADKSGFLKMNVRKGEVGGWKDQLTVAQSELIDKLIEEKLCNTGIDFTYVL